MTTSLGGAVLGDGVPNRTPLVALAALLLCLGAAIAPLAGLALLLGRHRTRIDPAAQLCVGVFLLGAAGMALLYHQGQSNLYFLRTGMPLLAAGAAWGVCSRTPEDVARSSVVRVGGAFIFGVIGMSLVSIRDWTSFSSGEAAASRLAQVVVAWAVLGVIGAVAVTVCAVVGRGRGRTARLAFGVMAVAFVAGCGAVRVPGQAAAWALEHRVGWVDVSANPAQSIDADGVQAAQWIRDNSDVNDVLVTNVFCSNGSTRRVNICDNRTFWVTAYAERRTIVSGWGYTATANGLASQAGIANSWQLPFWDQPRLDVVRDFLARPTDAGAQRLSRSGAGWLLAVPGYDDVSPQMAELLAPVYRAGDVVVYRLPSLVGASAADQLPSS